MQMHKIQKIPYTPGAAYTRLAHDSGIYSRYIVEKLLLSCNFFVRIEVLFASILKFVQFLIRI